MSYRHENVPGFCCTPVTRGTKSRELTDTHDKPRSPALLAIFDFYE
ncbi:hypothetical protein [Floridanema aerugineum]|uniref:Uncharacterized protein n=1 Tax=Floridaenema aerugineum BLCC-F46 TaxID=3153654 RepID=A0ABV4X1Z6_9CYAN